MNYTRMGGVAFFFLGCFFCVMGIVGGLVTESIEEWQLTRSGATTQGTIIDRRLDQIGSRKAYYITCNFLNKETGENMTQDKQVNPDTYNRLPKGSSVKVIYLPNNSNVWAVESIDDNPLTFLFIWGFLTFGLFGLSFLIMLYHGFTQSMIGLGVLLITLGILGFLARFLGGDSNRAIWQIFKIFGELIGSLELASGLAIVLGILIILATFGYKELKN